MAERTSASKNQAKKSKSARPPARSDKQASQSGLVVERLEELPSQSNAFPARKDALLQLQRQLGNRVVQRQIAERDKNRNLSTKGLNMEMLLEGHPYSLAVQREDDEAAGEEEAQKPSVDISIKLNKPQITRIPEKKVQEKHGKENIAGYTKPGIKVSVPKFKPLEIKIVITLDFYMDLASEYKGGRLQVLRDHENAHILIAEKVAKEYVVEPLKSELGEMSEFNEGNAEEIKGKFAAKLADFKTEEGNESQDFDDIDYPRMDQAYFGVATSLADLASGSAEVKTMVDAMDAFNSGAKAAAGDAEALGALSQAIVDGQAALSESNLARLQYNKEFKGKVAKAQGIVNKLNKKPDKLAEGVKEKLDEVTPPLEKFTWQPEIG